MTKIGEHNDRQILYLNVRTDLQWFEKLPLSNWLAFTIADETDKDLLYDMTAKCLDRNVLYTCSVGELASEAEDYFDEEIVWKQVQIEELTGKPQDYETSPMTTFHRNFDEGFWFAIQVACATSYDKDIPINIVVCIDLTGQGMENYITELLGKIKIGWLPSDIEVV